MTVSGLYRRFYDEDNLVTYFQVTFYQKRRNFSSLFSGQKKTSIKEFRNRFSLEINVGQTSSSFA